MNAYLVINLTGSVLFILYFLTKRIFGKRLSYAWYYRIITINIVLFMLPLDLLGDVYDTLWFYFKEWLGINHVDTMLFTPKSKMIFFTDEGVRLSYGLKIELIIYGIYLGGILATITAFLITTNKKRLYFREIVKKDIRLTDPCFEEIKTSLKIKKKVRLIACSNESQIATAWFFHPVILYCEPDEEKYTNTAFDGDRKAYRKEFIMAHELYHVKRADVLWKTFTYLINIIFFFNPVTYLLRREFERICELSCDEFVLNGQENDKRKIYAHALIDSSTDSERILPWASISWKKDIIDLLKERVEEATMNRKKIKNGVAVALAGLILGLSSITSMAYDTVWYGNPESTKYYTDNNEEAWALAVPTEKFLAFKNMDIPIIYDKQVYDKSGNVYPYDEYIDNYKNQTKGCIFHKYTTVTWSEHLVGINACEVVYYSEKMCTKCGKTKDKKEESRVPFSPCPH